MSDYSKIIIEDTSAPVTNSKLDEHRIAKIVVQESGIPGPAGSLEQLTVLAPLEYDPITKALRLKRPSAPNMTWAWSGESWVEKRVQNIIYVEHRILTIVEQSAGEFELSNKISVPGKLVFDVAQGGGPQFPNQDFEIIGEKLIRFKGFELQDIFHGFDSSA